MNTKVKNSETKNVKTIQSKRINTESLKKASKLLIKANSKKLGRKIKFDDLVSLALDLVTDEHISLLQNQTLKFEDRQELLRQKYIKMYGQISKDDFIGFMMTESYFDFLKTQSGPIEMNQAV